MEKTSAGTTLRSKIVLASCFLVSGGAIVLGPPWAFRVLIASGLPFWPLFTVFWMGTIAGISMMAILAGILVIADNARKKNVSPPVYLNVNDLIGTAAETAPLLPLDRRDIN